MSIHQIRSGGTCGRRWIIWTDGCAFPSCEHLNFAVIVQFGLDWFRLCVRLILGT